jgi:hypothetical protein
MNAIQELEKIIRLQSMRTYDVPNYVVYFSGKKLGEWTLYSAQASDGSVSVTFSYKGKQINFSNRRESSYEETSYGVEYQYEPLSSKAIEILNLIK